MNERHIRQLLEQVQEGDKSVEAALEALRHFPYEDLGHSRLDHHRAMRRGFPEVVFGKGKSVEQLTDIVGAILRADNTLLVTRIESETAATVCANIPDTELMYFEPARCLYYEPRPREDRGVGFIAVLSAGTSDQPVAEEASLTAELMGNRVERIFDVGVSGLHRTLAHYDTITKAQALIVVAGMEGALPSVIGGLVSKPVIGVPTSIGYGASMGGMTALLAMLNSCAAGVTVVNIDNGFGAGYAAALINRKPENTG